MHVIRSLKEAGDGFMAETVKATGEFATFEPENDPEGWHDFGAVEIQGETVFWKIDLYEADSDFRYGAEAPENPATTGQRPSRDIGDNSLPQRENGL